MLAAEAVLFFLDEEVPLILKKVIVEYVCVGVEREVFGCLVVVVACVCDGE